LELVSPAYICAHQGLTWAPHGSFTVQQELLKLVHFHQIIKRINGVANQQGNKLTTLSYDKTHTSCQRHFPDEPEIAKRRHLRITGIYGLHTLPVTQSIMTKYQNEKLFINNSTRNIVSADAVAINLNTTTTPVTAFTILTKLTTNAITLYKLQQASTRLQWRFTITLLSRKIMQVQKTTSGCAELTSAYTRYGMLVFAFVEMVVNDKDRCNGHIKQCSRLELDDLVR